MNEPAEPPTPVAAIADASSVPSLLPEPKCDPFLRVLTHLVNGIDRDGIGFVGITLQVGGILVTGKLASGGGFFKAQKLGFNEALRKAFNPGPSTDGLVSLFGKFFEPFEALYPSEPLPTSDEERQPSRDQPTHIHIADARLFLSNGAPFSSPQGIWWRGRLDAVDAFWLGEITIREE